MNGPRIAIVTPQQRAVIGEIARDGADNVTIGRRLGVSEHTVKSHVKAALAASKCVNRTALAVALLRGEVRLRTVSNRRWSDDIAA